ncbi:protein of unknown function [Bradyrhizobium vignae]|uniref:Uncharacterized protein n=1 Tax=Bradyrhizobium vignae TaxID=1549949 RepID=A0A2U3Q0Q1_9BRAD|nr:protein of unknown function [Bradyrhizobium vignae]
MFCLGAGEGWGPDSIVRTQGSPFAVSGFDRAIQYAAASRGMTSVSGILGHPPARLTTMSCTQYATPHIRPRAMVIVLPKSRGKPKLTNCRSAGKSGASRIPLAGLARSRLRLLHRDT